MTSRRWAMGGEEAVGVRLRVRVRSLGGLLELARALAAGLGRSGETSANSKNTARDLSGGRPAYGGRSSANSSSECCCCSDCDSEGLSQRPSASTWFFPRRRGAAGGVDVTGMGMGEESSRHCGRRAGGGEAEPESGGASASGRRELRAWAWGEVKVFRTVGTACCQCRGTRAP